MSKPFLNKMQQALDSLDLIEYVDSSFSATQVIKLLGYSNKGQYLPLLKDFLDLHEIDYSHWTSNGKAKIPLVKKSCYNCGNLFSINSQNREQVTCSKSCSNTLFRSRENHPNWAGGTDSDKNYRRLALDTYGYKCQRCNYDEHQAAIVVHHKDHNRKNNSISNLEVLCANCHAIHHWS